MRDLHSMYIRSETKASNQNLEVKCLWIGARETASPLLSNFFTIHGIPKHKLVEMCLTVLKDTLDIIQDYLYS